MLIQFYILCKGQSEMLNIQYVLPSYRNKLKNSAIGRQFKSKGQFLGENSSKLTAVLSFCINLRDKICNLQQFHMNNKLLLVIVLIASIQTVQSVDWQGYGNMSSSNLTDIWSYINSYALKAFSNSDYYKFSSGLSTHLNTLWHPAWNVITVKTIDTSDTVLYGYAFREHWMWFNGFRLSGNVYSFVIWKDYNCQDWGTVGDIQQGATDFTTEEQTQIKNSINSSADKSDIWLIAKTFMNSLKTQTLFKGDSTAFTVVLSQDNVSTSYYGRICMVKNKSMYSFMGPSSLFTTWGRYLLFQTR